MHRYIPLLNGTLRVRKSKFLKVSKGYFFKVIPPLGHVQNFFKWAIDNKVLDFLDDQKNMEKIDKSMNQIQVKKKQSDSKKTSVFTTTAKRQNLQVTVTFQ